MFCQGPWEAQLENGKGAGDELEEVGGNHSPMNKGHGLRFQTPTKSTLSKPPTVYSPQTQQPSLTLILQPLIPLPTQSTSIYSLPTMHQVLC